MLVAVSPAKQAAFELSNLAVCGDVRQRDIDLVLGQAVPFSDARPQEHGSVLGQQIDRDQEAESAGEHSLENPSRGSLRVRRQHPAHYDVRVYDGNGSRHRFRWALVSATAIRRASFSGSFAWRRAFATICAARLVVLTPYASRLSSIRLRIDFLVRYEVSFSARCRSGVSVIVSLGIGPSYHQLTTSPTDRR